MAGGFYGADVDKLRALAKQFDSAAERLEQVSSTLTSSVNQTQAWQGPDAAGFRSDWNGTHTAQLRSAVSALRTGSSDLAKNAEEQNTASTDVGGGGSGGGSGSGGGTGGGSTGGGHAGGGGGGGGGGGRGNYASGEASADVYWNDGQGVGYANAGTEYGPGGSVDHSAEAGWQWGAGAEASGEFAWEHVTGEGSVDGFVGVEGLSEANAGVDENGNYSADASAEGLVGAEVNASGSIDTGIGSVDAEGHAMAGAEVDAEVGGTIGPNGVGVNAGIDAFAGARAGGDVDLSVGGVGVGVGAEAWAGIGAKAEADVQLTYEEVGFSIDAGVALGVGGSVSMDFSFSPKQLVDGLGDIFGF